MVIDYDFSNYSNEDMDAVIVYFLEKYGELRPDSEAYALLERNRRKQTETEKELHDLVSNALSERVKRKEIKLRQAIELIDKVLEKVKTGLTVDLGINEVLSEIKKST